ncbi:SseB family protein [Novipirellula artificiosorum]|uniref:SseB protein N-terminal domain-containing protein n=1 Tax=Novipirellula artificiosorum TaxID=2528016 RepID=A0A5C6DIC5_9BACT|nr:SseB family protein [Novipirellula artificiosorum]TWU35955.1 hypothetical protein Poly41_37070 [Novipirellula artificiosorum]
MTTESNPSALDAAINDRDASTIRSLLLQLQFVLINIEDDEDDDESMGALTAEIEGEEVLVAFTSEENAGIFVEEMGDMFTDEDEVQGFVVDGETLLEYLPEDFGLLLNPETEQRNIIDTELVNEIVELGESPTESTD